VVRPLRVLFLALSLSALGCHAQTPPAPAKPLSPELARRVEILLRSRANLPPETEVIINPTLTPSEIPAYDTVTALVRTSDGNTSHPMQFLLSSDGKTLAQFTKYDISGDPKKIVSTEGRPARGGPAGAPVDIVIFDDLECPYCARSHANLFPALINRYGNQVHIVYRDFPLSIHPWAMRAAVDVNCLAVESPTAYWNAVDTIHAHAADIGVETAGTEKKPASLARANDDLDRITREEGKRSKIDPKKLDACIAKQDDSAIQAQMKLGESLRVDATPSLFINGDKIDGAVSIEFIEKIIDGALIAAGKTPPPPPPASATPAKAAEKPGS